MGYLQPKYVAPVLVTWVWVCVESLGVEWLTDPENCGPVLRVMDIAQALVARLELLARDGHDQVDYLTRSAFTDRSL